MLSLRIAGCAGVLVPEKLNNTSLAGKLLPRTQSFMSICWEITFLLIVEDANFPAEQTLKVIQML